VELSISADYTEIRNASAWLSRVCSGFSVPKGQIDRLDICLNEVLANIIDHGGEGAKLTPINLQIQINHDALSSQATVTVIDGGEAFDPTTFQQKDRSNSLEHAEPGGLGLTMMRQFVDKMSYIYCDGSNQLSFDVRWDHA